MIIYTMVDVVKTLEKTLYYMTFSGVYISTYKVRFIGRS